MSSSGTSWRDLFRFSRRERPGILLLCVLLLLTAALPRLFHTPPAAASQMELVRADSFFNSSSGQLRSAMRHHESDEPGPGGFPEKRSPSLSWFDPNELTYAEWEKLGLRERTIRVILHYREKGGRFRRAEDLSRIWGMPPQEYQRLKPYVRIAMAKAGPFTESRKASPAPVVYRDTTRVFSPRKSYTISRASIDVNQADSLQWLALPGIGEKLTSRILHFRESLGGFYSIDQVSETFGLSDSTFQLIRPRLALAQAEPRKIPLNSAPEGELQKHPYIRFRLARTIIRYRQEHGPFASVDDLKRLALVSDDLFAKLAPYCTTN